MLIQIERTEADVATVRRCNVPDCQAAAYWRVTDRDMPATNAASLGSLRSCAAHIAATYLTLHGAHVIAQTARAARGRGGGRDGDRRTSERQSTGRRHASGESPGERGVSDPPAPAVPRPA